MTGIDQIAKGQYTPPIRFPDANVVTVLRRLELAAGQLRHLLEDLTRVDALMVETARCELRDAVFGYRAIPPERISITGVKPEPVNHKAMRSG